MDTAIRMKTPSERIKARLLIFLKAPVSRYQNDV